MGGLMFLAGFGVLTLLHHDMQPFAQRLMTRLAGNAFARPNRSWALPVR